MTIANVSLPQIQGALSASPDQVAWVVTSNLIATAVTIPLASWVSSYFGRRRAMIWGVVGFGIASLMCGLSTSLGELVFWRVLQSAFVSPLTPIAQSVVLDAFTGKRRARATAIYMMGVGIPPTIAPLLGGYVCEELSWSWVFFILIPIAIFALIGLLAFVKPDSANKAAVKLDWTGFLSLAMCIACIQLMLDRGEREEWFDSIEIVIEFFLAVLFGWMFLAHSLSADSPLFDFRLLLERNFALGIGIHAIFGMLFVTPMVLMPAMLQQLRDVPEFAVGILIAVRGVATAVSMLMMVFFASRWDPRILLLIGFGTHTYAGMEMANFDMNVSIIEMSWTMFIQGFGVGCLWVPMTLVTFSNLDQSRSVEGASMFNLVRSIGSSFYISASFVVIFHTQKMSYSELVQWISPFRERLNFESVMGYWDTPTSAGLVGMAVEVMRQATNIGYINVFNLFLWASLFVYPLVALIVWPPRDNKM